MSASLAHPITHRTLARRLLACAALTAAAFGGVAATAAHAASDPQAPQSWQVQDSSASPIVDGHASLALTDRVPDLTASGTDGAATDGHSAGARLWVQRGSLLHAQQRFTGGRAFLQGGVELGLHGNRTVLDHMSLDLGTGALHARIDGTRVTLGHIDTDRMHINSSAGQHRVFFSVRGDVALTAGAADVLDSRLGTDRFRAGDPLFHADVAVGVPLDRALAADLGIGYDAAVGSDIQADVDRDAPTDLGLGMI